MPDGRRPQARHPHRDVHGAVHRRQHRPHPRHRQQRQGQQRGRHGQGRADHRLHRPGQRRGCDDRPDADAARRASQQPCERRCRACHRLRAEQPRRSALRVGPRTGGLHRPVQRQAGLRGADGGLRCPAGTAAGSCRRAGRQRSGRTAHQRRRRGQAPCAGPRLRGAFPLRLERPRPRRLVALAGAAADAYGVRAAAGHARRLHADPVPRQACRRRPALQGDRQLHGRPVHGLAWLGHRLVQCLHKTDSTASD